MSLLKAETALPAHRTYEQSVVHDVVNAFFRSQRNILLAILAFLILVTALVALDHKTYESRLLFLVRNEASTFPTDSVAGREDAQLGPVDDTRIGTEIELLSSLDLHRQVLLALHPGLSPAAIDRELLKFDRLLQVLPVPKTSLISVTYTAGSQQEANNTLATLSRLYLDYRAKIRGSDGAYSFFDQQAGKYHAMLQNDQKQMADFNQKYQVTLIGEQKDVTVHRLADARALLYDNEASLGEAQKRIQSMTAAQGTLPARVVTQRRDLPDQLGASHLGSELVDLQNERVALLTKFHPSDRHVLEVDQKIANISAALQRTQTLKATEEQTDLNPLRQTVDSDLQQSTFRAAGLHAKGRALAAQVSAYGAKLDELNQVTAENEDLTRKIKEDEASYELYVAKREGARINKTLDTDKIANVRPVSGPSLVPHGRSQTFLSVLLIYVIGALLIAGLGTLAGLWSPRFYSPAELEAALDTPVLATVPLLPDSGGVERANADWPFGRVPLRRAAPVEEKALVPRELPESRPVWPGGQLARYTARIHNDGSRRAGAYVSLIERLRRQVGLKPGIGAVFAFTSCNRGEGVSHFVRGLGAELTEYTGKRVAIVNALDSYEANGEHTGEAPLDVQRGEFKSGEDFLRQWFQRLREAHDYVLIDCPALSTSHAATVIGPQTDGVLLVVEAGKATRSQLRGGLAMLSLASVSVMGLALNKRRYPVPAAIYNLL
jgi:uncharacterized protein involved in exopolysaccharide biosynthesis